MRPVARVTPSFSSADNNSSYYDMNNYQQNQQSQQANSGMNNSGSYSYSGYTNVPYYQLANNSSSANATSGDGTINNYSGYYDYNSYSSATATTSGNSADYSAVSNAYANYPYYSTDSTSSNNYPFTYSDQSGSNSDRKKAGGYQPWVKRDSLKRPAPYSGGKGMSLMQKMGWRQGQGLGRHEDGAIEPSFPDIKMDKRGLAVSSKETAEIQVWMKPSSSQRKKSSSAGGTIGTIKIVTEGKNAISILEEYCTKRKIETPRYETAVDEGPIHAKHFVFKVSVEGVDYTAEKGSNVKKEAKQLAAKKCLQDLGILPKEASSEEK